MRKKNYIFLVNTTAEILSCIRLYVCIHNLYGCRYEIPYERPTYIILNWKRINAKETKGKEERNK